MKRLCKLAVMMALVATLGLASACQRTVEVQTGTRIVDSQGRVISEDIHTVRVPPETAGAYRVETIVRPDSDNPQLVSLYNDAQSAIAAGDLKLAQRKLDAVIAISAGYRNAKKQSEAIKRGDKVKPDTAPAKPSSPSSSKTTSTSPPPAKPPIDVTTSLQRWTPDTITGFTAAKASFDPLSVSREYRPESGSAAKTLVIVAEQFRSSDEAKRALTYEVKQRYPNSASTSTIHGHTVYFGTDGRQFATMGFTSGAVMVALEASAESGGPSGMKSTLASVVGQLP